MNPNFMNMNDKIYANNNNILIGIINDLQQIINNSHDSIIINRLANIIIKMNNIINDNKKNTELIINTIKSLENKLLSQMNNIVDKGNTNLNKQELVFGNVRYVGQVVNGLPEGKGIAYYDSEPFKGDKYDGDWKNGKREGKGIYYYHNGDRFEGEWSNDNKEGKGIKYFHNGDRRMGDYHNGNRIGKHVTLTRDGEVNVQTCI